MLDDLSEELADDSKNEDMELVTTTRIAVALVIIGWLILLTAYFWITRVH